MKIRLLYVRGDSGADVSTRCLAEGLRRSGFPWRLRLLSRTFSGHVVFLARMLK
jgi:hypothetical protein